VTIIDYLGFRVLAMVSLDGSGNIGNSLIYGSNNAGATFENSDSQMRSLMSRIIVDLNLQGHKTRSGDWIEGPIDLEGHLGKDKRRYVTDLARLMPPEDYRILQ